MRYKSNGVSSKTKKSAQSARKAREGARRGREGGKVRRIDGKVRGIDGKVPRIGAGWAATREIWGLDPWAVICRDKPIWLICSLITSPRRAACHIRQVPRISRGLVMHHKHSRKLLHNSAGL